MKSDDRVRSLAGWRGIVAGLVVIGASGLNAGCDSEVTSSVLSTLNTATNSIVDAAFTALADQIASDTSTTVTTTSSS